MSVLRAAVSRGSIAPSGTSSGAWTNVSSPREACRRALYRAFGGVAVGGLLGIPDQRRVGRDPALHARLQGRSERGPPGLYRCIAPTRVRVGARATSHFGSRGQGRDARARRVETRRNERLTHSHRAWPPVALLERERAIDYPRDGRRHPRDHFGERRRRPRRGVHQKLRRVVTVVHEPPGNQREQRRAHGPEVRAAIDLLGSREGLLGGP